jgi:hypothetical protein
VVLWRVATRCAHSSQCTRVLFNPPQRSSVTQRLTVKPYFAHLSKPLVKCLMFCSFL